MDLRQYLSMLRRRWRLLVLVVALGLGIAWVTAPGEPPPKIRAYEATATLVPAPGAGNVNLAREAFLITSGEIPELAAEQLGGESPEILASQVVAEVNKDLGAVQISTTQTDRQEAEDIANAFAQAVVLGNEAGEVAARQASLAQTSERMEALQEEIRVLDGQIGLDPPDRDLLVAERDALVRQYSLAYERFQQLAAEPEPASSLAVLQEAIAVPVDTGFQAPASRAARLGIAAVVALVLGIGIALMLERMDTRIRDRFGAEAAFGLQVVAEIPALPAHRRPGARIVTAESPSSAIAESYRNLRSSLQLLTISHPTENGHRGKPQPDGPPPSEKTKTILLTSAGPGEGKTTSVANLAAAYAETGRTVLVVSCDFRRPRIEKLLGVDIAPGISDLDRAQLSDDAVSAHVRPTELAGVSVLPAGPPVETPAQFIGLDPSFIRRLRHLADVIILDSAPLLAANDASELLPAADAVVVCGRANKTTIESAHRAGELLERLHAPVAGAVLIGAPKGPVSRRYYYRYELRRRGPFASLRAKFRREKADEPITHVEQVAAVNPERSETPVAGTGATEGDR